MDANEEQRLLKRYSIFRVLVIGRANAGKTTLLKRVCNTMEEPSIYDEKNENLLEPTTERGVHDINRQFVFESNPRFVFHDSPGFEAGGKKELEIVRDFITKRSKAHRADDQLHAIWFCFLLNGSRPLLKLEKEFFEEQRAGDVPVIAIFTKFDDLIVQVYDRQMNPAENSLKASKMVAEKFQGPLSGYRFPPRAFVQFGDLQNDEGNHQEQVRILIEKTASSLDSLALKVLFVSIQQNNLEICIEYAMKYGYKYWKRDVEVTCGVSSGIGKAPIWTM